MLRSLSIKFFTALLLVASTIESSCTAFATDGSQRISVMHTAPDGRSLPATANWVVISVELTNTVATDLKVRLVGSRDGKFIDIAFPQGALNKADHPTYEIEIPAPAAALTYQFIVHQPNGELVTSKRFAVERPCIQNFKVEVAGDVSDAPFRKKVTELVAKAKILERDRANYEGALKILEDLKNHLPG